MSHSEKRELEITSADGGSSIELSREGTTILIERVTLYTNFRDGATPIELEDTDRRALMEFLNMGEYRELSHEERR